MKKLILLFIVSASLMFPQSAGNTGLSFLKLGFGARNIAMGDAGATAANDVTALNYNPAIIAGLENTQLTFMHNSWIQDVRSELGGVKFDLFNLPFAIGFNVTTISDIQVREIAGDPISTFNGNYFCGSISTGFFISDNLSFGTTLKYLYEGILNDEGEGFGLDFGLRYKTNIEGLFASAVIRNLGSMSPLRNEKTKLPAEIRIGPAYNFALPESKLSFTAAGEFQKYLSTNDIHFNLGAEALYNGIFAIRAGYQTGYISKGFTAGAGLRWGNLVFDYALTPFALGLGSGNSISLSFSF